MFVCLLVTRIIVIIICLIIVVHLIIACVCVGVFDDNEDDFFVYFECVCVVKRGLNNHDDKEMEFCLFVCIGELSRIE